MLRRSLRMACAAKPASFDEQYASTKSNIKGGARSKHRTCLQLGLERQTSGALLKALEVFNQHNCSLDFISSRTMPVESTAKYITMFIDVELAASDPKLTAVLDGLANVGTRHVSVLGSWEVPWYPKSIADLDNLDQTTLAAGAELEDNAENPHPGFHDNTYRERRRTICANAGAYRHGMSIPTVDYTADEVATWNAVWNKLIQLYPTHACKQHRHALALLEENAGYGPKSVPQLQQVSEFLEDATGFTLRPVAGLLTSRDFLNALAFRVFFSTQYLRHHSKPLYTPEPDLCHELMGHAPLFADPVFAEFSQTIGLASLGASDEIIEGLARCYWFTVEFGVCREGGATKACGAGLLSSFGELEYCVSDKPKINPWDPYVAAKTPFPITSYQPQYFLADSFDDMQAKMKEYCGSLDLPYRLEYMHSSRRVKSFPNHPILSKRV